MSTECKSIGFCGALESEDSYEYMFIASQRKCPLKANLINASLTFSSNLGGEKGGECMSHDNMKKEELSLCYKRVIEVDKTV